jgi:hypothetical protein
MTLLNIEGAAEQNVDLTTLTVAGHGTMLLKALTANLDNVSEIHSSLTTDSNL